MHTGCATVGATDACGDGSPRQGTSDTTARHWAGLASIAEGWFQSVSEVVRAGLRHPEKFELKLEALRALLAAGEASP